MTTWNLSLTPVTAGTLKTPGAMTASWGANKPSEKNPAHVGDTLVVTFPFPTTGDGTRVLLNLSWASSKNSNPEIVAFNGTPVGASVEWTAIVMRPTTYVFRAIVVVYSPSSTDGVAYEIDDPEMVVSDGPNC